MCLAVIALDAHPRYRVVIAANRDEFHARPAAPAHWWTNGVLAGTDLIGGGSWFGVSRQGRWALITNFREGVPRDPQAPSRGGLVMRALQDGAPPLASAASIACDGARYHGFNLIVGVVDGGVSAFRARTAAADASAAHPHLAAYASNRASGAISLSAGIHGLSNHLLETPWPKVVQSRARLAAALEGEALDTAAAFALLADRTPADDAALPTTGLPRHRERLLSSAFILSPEYGTRCSTLLTIGRDGSAEFIERSFDPTGAITGEAAYAFTISRADLRPLARASDRGQRL
ncbi:MAG: NRDE family protein [Pseudomonadota bacterium]|nr:NRDE family protein [Pseudomonadota bacterium]